jgi:hypothetical protein
MGHAVTAREFRKWLEDRGCTFSPGSGGELVVEREGLIATLPLHGDDRRLGSILTENIKRALGLDRA